MGTPGEGDPLAELRAEMADVKKALADLAAASTQAEKREAREDVDDAEADLAAAAKRAGVPVGKIKAAIEAAKKQEFLDNYSGDIRSIVNDEMAKLLDEAEEAEGKPEGGGPAREPKAPAAAKGEAPPAEKPKAPDSEPVVPHWSEKKIGEMVRG